MAHIGSFKKVGTEFVGDIATLEVDLRNVRFVPETGRSGENPPSHLVFAGRAEIGAVWLKPAPSPERRDYYSVKIDDPSLREPIQANLYADDRGEGWNLIWTRPTKQKAAA
ncbi:hypothetical protein AS593_06565 [Caulobacter vibrioides]|nr:hypothetical protein AS593_06565 [Caulobacter vibrioides]